MKKIGVVGAGMMGSEIALTFALAGHKVYLTDRSLAQTNAAITNLQAVLSRGIKRGQFEPMQAERALECITTGVELSGYEDCEVVIEAVFEDAVVKGETYQRLVPFLRDDCILATNTSSISITALSGNLLPKQRARFLGTHYFSPVTRMPLVEVIPSLDTAAATVDTMFDLLKSVGKEPIRVKDVVGFAVNRVLHMFFIEATRLVEEGVISVEDMDKACKLGLGHPIGPFELMDVTTNNLGLEVQDILHHHYGERFLPRPILRNIVAAGYNGKKYGRGWYKYVEGKRVIE